MSESPLHVVSVQTTNEKGGGEYANVNLLEALAQRGSRVKLLTNMPELADGTSVPTQQIDLGPKLSRRTVRRVVAGFAPGVVRLARALRREAREAPIDVLLLHFKKEQLMGPLLPRGLVGAIVWAEWGPLPLPLRTGALRRAYALAARSARLVLAVSDSTRASLLDAGIPPRKVVVVPPLVDAGTIRFDADARERRRREWGVGAGTFVVGCISRLHASKRNDVVIDALEHLPDDVILVIAGSGEDEAELRERAERFGDRVRFLPTPRGYVHEILSACEVQVFAPQPLEGLPRAIIFGQLTERPILVTEASKVTGLVPDGTGSSVEPANDPAALAALLMEYRSDPERRAREGSAGRRFALERYDTQRATDQVDLRLRRVAGRASPPRARVA
ncbi:MAG: glycosyltransferase family 4 protein [Solirubrobacteraceae bacterium]